MGALLLAEALVAAAAELHLLPAAVTCVVLAATAFLWWRIQYRSLLFGFRPAEPELLRPTATAIAATTTSASTSPPLHFVALCISMGAVLHAEPLITAAELLLPQAVVVCAVFAFAALFNSVILSLNLGVVAVRSSDPPHSALVALAALIPPTLQPHRTPTATARNPTPAAATPPPIAPVQEPPRAAAAVLARAAFVVLTALMSTSWFIEPFASATAELRLPWLADTAILVLFATCFYAAVHIFRSFFLPRPPAAAAPQWEGVAAIAAVGVGITACLVAAGGSAYMHTPARI